MKTISLTQGKFALVDDADYEWLNQWKWYAIKNHQCWYAVRDPRKDESPKPSKICMHRVILGVPDGLETDHINGDGLDNRRANLRPATRSLNQRNRTYQRPDRRHKLPMGVRPQRRHFRATIVRNNCCRQIGTFDTPEEAHEAYLTARAKNIAEEESRVAEMIHGGAS